MGEPRDDREDRPRSERRRDEGGPRGTSFLDLEISSVLYDEADRLCREAARELLWEAIREQLQERLGDHLQEIGRLAADALADDIETNLQIESLIVDRRDARGSIGERVRAIMRARPEAKPGAGTARGRKDKKSKKRAR